MQATDQLIPANKSKEIKALTGIRGIAAVYVMIYHYFYNIGYFVDDSIFTSIVKQILDSGYLAVDLFFILSGFVLMLSYTNVFKNMVTTSDYESFIKKRFARIYPAYIVAVILSCIFLTQFRPISSAVLSPFLLSIFSSKPQVLGVLWSLSTEWVIYLFFPFWVSLLLSKYIKYYYILIIIFIVCYGIIYLTFFDTYRVVDRAQFPYALLRGIGAYSLGIFIYNYKKIHVYTDFIFFIILVCLATPRFDIVTVFLFAALIKNLSSENKSLLSRFCSQSLGYWLGEISYSMYLVHLFVLEVMIRVLHIPKHGFSPEYFVSYVLVSIFVSYLYYISIELPLSKRLKILLMSRKVVTTSQ